MMIRTFCTFAIVLVSTGLLSAQDAPPAGAPESAEAVFERRIVGRADKILDRLQLADPAQAIEVRHAVLRFYRDLHAVHLDRDQRLAALPTGDAHRIGRVQFESDKESSRVYGELTGALARMLNDGQVDAVKDWMTFDMVRLSIADFERMFPAMSERQREQIRTWLVHSREVAVIAGSAETKLDVFRVNKMRMHAYLAAQGFDVDSAVRAEEARKAAEKKAA